MPDVPSMLAEIVGLVAPQGIEEADLPDFHAFAENVKAAQAAQSNAVLALYRIFERNERRGAMPRWVRNDSGKLVLDLDGEKSPEEAEEGTRRLREMSEAGTPPMTAVWNPRSVMVTTGCTPAECDHYFPTKAKFAQWCKARGLTDVSNRDVVQSVSRETVNPRVEAEQTRDRVDEAMAHLKRTHQINDKNEVLPGAPFIPLPVPPNGSGANGGHVKRFEADPIPQAAAEDDLVAAVIDIPLNERPKADTRALDKALYDGLMANAVEKARARGASGI